MTKIPEPDHDDGNCEEEITKKLNSISTTTEKETEAEEVNFFADMEPVIKPTTNLLAMSATTKAEDTVSQNIFLVYEYTISLHKTEFPAFS